MIQQFWQEGEVNPQMFLAWEQNQDEKYEYADGEITAMTGGSVRHNDLVLRLFLELQPKFAEKNCKLNIADVKLIINEEKYYYPDLIVTCDSSDLKANDGIRKPILIAEVLSPTTSDRDRGEKKNNYLKIPSLQEYILIDSTQPVIEYYFKQSEKVINYQLLEEEDDLKIKSIDLEISLAKIFQEK